MFQGNYGGHSSFGKSFASAARDLGPGKTFNFNGSSFSTNRADGRDMRIGNVSSFGGSSISSISSTRNVSFVGGSSISSIPSTNVSFVGGSSKVKPVKAVGNVNLKSCETKVKPVKAVGNVNLKSCEIAVKMHSKHMIKYQSSITSAANKYKIPESVIKGIISRESGAGTLLGKNGCNPGYGDKNNAFGLMQIDKRHHSVDTSKGINNIDAGAKILHDNLKSIEKKFPKWTKDQQLRGAVAAYNFGVKNVKSVKNLDKGTSANNYSEDVMARSKLFKKSSQ